MRVIPEGLAKKHQLIPLRVQGSEVHVAMADPLSHDAREDVQFLTGFNLVPYVSTKSEIEAAIDKAHKKQGASVDSIINDMQSGQQIEVVDEDQGPAQAEDIKDLKEQSEAAPIVKVVNLIISSAVEQKASDIHVEPAKSKLGDHRDLYAEPLPILPLPDRDPTT